MGYLEFFSAYGSLVLCPALYTASEPLCRGGGREISRFSSHAMMKYIVTLYMYLDDNVKYK